MNDTNLTVGIDPALPIVPPPTRVVLNGLDIRPDGFPPQLIPEVLHDGMVLSVPVAAITASDEFQLLHDGAVNLQPRGWVRRPDADAGAGGVEDERAASRVLDDGRIGTGAERADEEVRAAVL